MLKIYSKKNNDIYYVTLSKLIKPQRTVLHFFKEGWQLNKICVSGQKLVEKLICDEESGILLPYTGHNDINGVGIYLWDKVECEYPYYNKTRQQVCVIIERDNGYTITPEPIKVRENAFTEFPMKVVGNALLDDPVYYEKQTNVWTKKKDWRNI